MTSPDLLAIVTFALVWGQGHGSQVWKCRASKPDDQFLEKMCQDRCEQDKCEKYCICDMSDVVDSCGDLDFAPNNFITINETAQPGTHIFSIHTKNQESWSYKLDRSENIDGSLWRDLQDYFRFKRFGSAYEMIVDKTPDLEHIYLRYSIKLKTLKFSMTCSSPGVPDQTTDLLVVIRPINEYAPQFIGAPLHQRVSENTPIGTPVFSMENVTIDRDVNPSNKEISVFRLHKYHGSSMDSPHSMLDSLAYFSMPNLQKGVITVREALDFEALNAIGATDFLLNVSAADVHGNISYTTLSIVVSDVNDLPPEFRHPSCPLHIQRSRPCPVSFQARIIPGYKGPLKNMIPAPIQARDMDAIGDNITLSLDKGPGELTENADHFVIDNTTGVVTVLSPFLEPIEVDLVVVAREESALSRTTQAPFKVSVIEDKAVVIPATDQDRLPQNQTQVGHDTNNIKGKTDGRNRVNDGDRSEGDSGGSGSSDSTIAGMDKNTIFLIIIGVLSLLVLILAVMSTCILCSIKKDQRTKVVPLSSLPNNLTFTDHPSSYHRSLDRTSLDLTHDEFDIASDRNFFINSKSRSSVVSNKNRREYDPNNGRHMQSVSRTDYDRIYTKKDPASSQKSDKKSFNNVQSIMENGELPGIPNVIYRENLCCTPLSPGNIYNKRNLARSTSSVSKTYSHDRMALHSRDSTRSKSSSLQRVSQNSGSNHVSSPTTSSNKTNPSLSSNRVESGAPLNTGSTDNSKSSRSQNRKKRKTSSQTNPRSSQYKDGVVEGKEIASIERSGELGQSVNLLEKQGGDQNRPNDQPLPVVKQRRIRIPSGVLIMTEHVSTTHVPDNVNVNSTCHNDDDDDDDEEDDDDDDDDDDDEDGDAIDDDESDATTNNDALATDDATSTCSYSFTLSATPGHQECLEQGKQRVSFQLDARGDVVSVLPVDLSSCQSSDEAFDKPGHHQSQLDNNDKRHKEHRDSNASTPENPPLNNLHVPDGCSTPLSNNLQESVLAEIDGENGLGEEKLFQKVVQSGNMNHDLGRADDPIRRHPMKQRRLPGLNIPKRKSTSDICPPKVGRIKKEGRPLSENAVGERQDWDSNSAPQTERERSGGHRVDELSSATETTAESAVSSAIRRKKRQRRTKSEVRVTDGDLADTVQTAAVPKTFR